MPTAWPPVVHFPLFHCVRVNAENHCLWGVMLRPKGHFSLAWETWPSGQGVGLGFWVQFPTQAVFLVPLGKGFYPTCLCGSWMGIWWDSEGIVTVEEKHHSGSWPVCSPGSWNGVCVNRSSDQGVIVWSRVSRPCLEQDYKPPPLPPFLPHTWLLERSSVNVKINIYIHTHAFLVTFPGTCELSPDSSQLLSTNQTLKVELIYLLLISPV